MGELEVPNGNSEAEASTQDASNASIASPDTAALEQKKQAPPRKKHVRFGIGLAVLVLAAVLIFIIPDWVGEDAVRTDKASEAADVGDTPTGETPDEPNTGETPDEPNTGDKPVFEGFSPALPFFNENITKGYQTQEDLETDLSHFAFFTANQAIGEIRSTGFYYGGGCSYGYGRLPDVWEEDMMKDEGSMPEPVPGSDGSTVTGDFFDNVNSFETNNQEDGIDTGDKTKSDGTYVYAAYGDSLLVWSAADGDLKSQIEMPPVTPKETDYPDKGTYPDKDFDKGTTDSKARSMPFPYISKPRIDAVLLEGDKLTLVVTGYGAEYANEKSPILCNYLSTRIMIYDTNDGEPQLISYKDVHGNFRQAYSIVDEQKVGHVVTQASIDTWTHLTEPLSRQYFPKELTDEEYQEQAIQKAQDELVPAFVENLSGILTGIDMTRLSLFAEDIKDEDTLDGIMSQLRVADAISIVSSFVMDGDISSPKDFAVSTGGAMHSGSWGYVYANNQMILLADKGYGYEEEMDEYVEMTYLVGFRMDGASTKHEIVGSVRGTPLNPYSLDFVEKEDMVYVRIATTMNFWTNRVLEDDAGTALEEDTSSTRNEIIVLGTEKTGSLLEQKSSVRLGKPNETFTAVRFLDNIAYAVTFLKTDPFYAVDLTDPNDIRVLGELEISGFSEYLHPLTEDKLLAVGQETDADGNNIGMQISLFGASDPTNLTLINRLVIEKEEDQWQSTSVSWEPKAFRFFTVADMGFLIIPLNIQNHGSWQDGNWVMPKEDENFRGFVVFTVEKDTITRRFDINHLDFIDGRNQCSAWCGSLPERSFVIDGNVLTLKSQSVVSTNLGTERSEWFLDVQKAAACCV